MNCNSIQNNRNNVDFGARINYKDALVFVSEGLPYGLAQKEMLNDKIIGDVFCLSKDALSKVPPLKKEIAKFKIQDYIVKKCKVIADLKDRIHKNRIAEPKLNMRSVTEDALKQCPNEYIYVFKELL